MTDTTDKAINILRATRDGDDLAPHHLGRCRHGDGWSSVTIHYLPTYKSAADEAFRGGWSKTCLDNHVRATMCGIPAMKHGAWVDPGPNTDQLADVTCPHCLRSEANRQTVIRNGWAGKAVRNVKLTTFSGNTVREVSITVEQLEVKK